jgi:hypothetical protein
VEQDGFVLKVAPLGAAAADVHGHIEGAWKGVESKPTQHRLHRLSHRLHGKNLDALLQDFEMPFLREAPYYSYRCNL